LLQEHIGVRRHRRVAAHCVLTVLRSPLCVPLLVVEGRSRCTRRQRFKLWG
jgi:hypothetical protein